MQIKHFFVEKIAHSSYILAGHKTCAVIDPQRDVDVYVNAAREMGVRITHIIQTHLHADFISGHIDLAEKTGAAIYMAKSANGAFEHKTLVEGDTLTIEDIKIEVLETPGHTPEHLSYVLTDLSRGESPIGVFTGDTLFVGDVGRPDLFPGKAVELASKLYDSIHEKLLKLPDFCEVYPAHGAGSLCGRAMGAKYTSTIGYERKHNPVLQIADKAEFIRSLTEDMPPAPDHFSRCSEVNRKGPVMLKNLPSMHPVEPQEFSELMQSKNNVVVDTRPYLQFGGLHIPGVWHIDLDSNFPTHAGWLLPIDKDILLVADSHEKAEEARLWAQRVGLDRVAGYLAGGMHAWLTGGYPTESVGQISGGDLQEMLADGEDLVVLDVRAAHELESGAIDGAVNIPTADLRTRSGELDPARKIVVVCGSGLRGSIGAAILKKHGFHSVYNLAGGMMGYNAAKKK